MGTCRDCHQEKGDFGEVLLCGKHASVDVLLAERDAAIELARRLDGHLVKAQEERDEAERKTRWASQFQCSVHGDCDWSMVSTAKTCMATLSNGQPCNEALQRGPNPLLAAERDAEAQRALVEAKDVLIQEGINDLDSYQVISKLDDALHLTPAEAHPSGQED